MQINNRFDGAHENKPVIGLQSFLRFHGWQDGTITFNLGQVQAGQAA